MNENKIKQQLYKNHQNILPYSIVLFIIILRICLIFIPLNYDYPDQYWQGPQIAYKIFNKIIYDKNIGYQTWQWTIQNPIRNPIYQYLLSFGYILLDFLFQKITLIQSLNTYIKEYNLYDYFLQLGPKIIQSLIAIISDIYLIKLLYLNFGYKNVNKLSIIIIITNHFYLSMMSRTYINSFQYSLMIISFYYWQINHQNNQYQYQYQYQYENYQKQFKIFNKYDMLSRSIVLISYVARPTSLIPWMVIWPYELYHTIKSIFNDTKVFNMKSTVIIFFKLIIKNLIQIILMISFSFLIGSMYFGKYIITQWNFFYVMLSIILGIFKYFLLQLQYNLILKWSQCFETHLFYFYYFISTPIILGFFGLILVVGLFNGIFGSQNYLKQIQNHKIKQKSFKQIVFFLLSLSVILTLMSAHKQNRFLMILLPFMFIVTFGGYLKLQKLCQSSQKRRYFLNGFIFFCIIFNIFLFVSISIYPRGGFSTLRYLRQDIDKELNQQIQDSLNKLDKFDKLSVIYLTDSHALPGYSIILRDIILQIPDDSPSKKIKNQSQIDLLIEQPQKLFNLLYKRSQHKSTHKQSFSIDYIITQRKYLAQKIYPSQNVQKFDRIIQKYYFSLNKNTQLSQQQQGQTLLIEKNKWRFLIENYEMIYIQRNSNLWQQIIIGLDQIYLFKKKKIKLNQIEINNKLINQQLNKQIFKNE